MEIDRSGRLTRDLLAETLQKQADYRSLCLARKDAKYVRDGFYHWAEESIVLRSFLRDVLADLILQPPYS